ncbi:hypothetical protein [uncultured Sphingomonas sp.]|uniref:hypothetical protein n=1 Tax=uncultured Sphingomonas sp. TaxID=158754 RepID=UPI0025D0B0D1|nr:hypothetical protein [uncultured Sphingomonas sp.]
MLLEDGHDAATYHLTGPEALTMKQIAAALTAARGKPVRYLDLPTPLYRASMRLAGVDRWLRRGLVAQYADVVAKGHDIAVTHEVRRITGRAPKPFATWAAEHRDRFL